MSTKLDRRFARSIHVPVLGAAAVAALAPTPRANGPDDEGDARLAGTWTLGPRLE